MITRGPGEPIVSAPPEPNRLRSEAVPNSIRVGIGPGAARPSSGGATRRADARAKARSIGSRGILACGAVIAAAGVPFFFASGLAAQEVGLGLICLGAGIAMTVAARQMAVDAVATARQSRLAAAGVLVFGQHLVVFGAAGLGLIAFGLMVLAVALGVI